MLPEALPILNGKAFYGPEVRLDNSVVRITTSSVWAGLSRVS